MKKKKTQSETQKIGEWNREWWQRSTWRMRSSVWGITIIGIGFIIISFYGLLEGNILSLLGTLLFGLGLTAAGGSFLIGIYWKLTERSLFRVWIVNRVGLMVLGPAIVLIAAPWKDIAKGWLTAGQCILICIAFCGFSLLPAGWSLVRLIIERHRESEKKQKDPWE